MVDLKKIINLFFEAGVLTRIKRSGDIRVGNPNPPSVSDHAYRAMLVGYILAKLESVDDSKVLKMLLFRYLPEARIKNLDRIANRYLDVRKAENTAFGEQVSNLPEGCKDELLALKEERVDKKTKEAIVAYDASCLTDALEAKEATEKG